MNYSLTVMSSPRYQQKRSNAVAILLGSLVPLALIYVGGLIWFFCITKDAKFQKLPEREQQLLIGADCNEVDDFAKEYLEKLNEGVILKKAEDVKKKKAKLGKEEELEVLSLIPQPQKKK